MHKHMHLLWQPCGPEQQYERCSLQADQHSSWGLPCS